MPNKNFELVHKEWKEFAIYDRNTFGLKLQEKCLGAIGSYACCALACKNKLEDRNQYIYHWLSEYVRLGLEEFKYIFDQKTKTNFNKMKVVDQEIAYCKTKVKSYISRSTTHILTSYKLKSLKIKLTESDFNHLFDIIRNMNSNYDKEREYWGIRDRGYRFFGETKPHYDDYLVP